MYHKSLNITADAITQLLLEVFNIFSINSYGIYFRRRLLVKHHRPTIQARRRQTAPRPIQANELTLYSTTSEVEEVMKILTAFLLLTSNMRQIFLRLVGPGNISTVKNKLRFVHVDAEDSGAGYVQNL
jgi:hypothetical protein